MNSVVVGNVRVDVANAQAALARTAQMIGAGGGTLFTPNVHHVALARSDSEFAAAYARAGLCLCDGRPVQWAAQALGVACVHLPGSRFLPLLLHAAATRHWRVYFVGGRAGLGARLPQLIAERFAGLLLVGVSPPAQALMSAPPSALAAVADSIVAAKPQLTLVSLPSPLQEIWADAAHRQAGGGVFVCTGSAIDRLAGLANEAPAWLGGAGLEWAWRIGQEPLRLGPRYAADAVAVAPLALRTALLALRRWRRR